MSGVLAFLMRNPLAAGLGVLLLIAGLALGVQTVRLAWSQEETLKAENAFKDFKIELAEKSRKAAEDMAALSAAAAVRAAETAQRALEIGERGKQEIRNVYAAGGTDVCDRARGAVVDSVQSVFSRGNRGDPVGPAGRPPAGALRGPAAAVAPARGPGK